MANIALGTNVTGAFTAEDPKRAGYSLDQYDVTGLEDYQQLTIELTSANTTTPLLINLIETKTGNIVATKEAAVNGQGKISLSSTTVPGGSYRLEVGGQSGSYTVSTVNGGKATSIVTPLSARINGDGSKTDVGTVGTNGQFFSLASSNANIDRFLLDVALGADPTKIYGIGTNAQDQDILFKIDPSRATADQVTEVGFVRDSANNILKINLNALAFGPDGQLYTIGSGASKLYTVDLTTAVATSVGDLPAEFISSGDLVYDAVGNRFLAASVFQSLADSSTLWSIPIANPATATKLGTIGFPGVKALSFENGQLKGFTGGVATAVGDRITIDTTTGIGTLQDKIGNDAIVPINNGIGGAATITLGAVVPVVPPAAIIPPVVPPVAVVPEVVPVIVPVVPPAAIIPPVVPPATVVTEVVPVIVPVVPEKVNNPIADRPILPLPTDFGTLLAQITVENNLFKTNAATKGFEINAISKKVTSTVNQIGIFAVDDTSGKIGSFVPGTPEYLKAVLDIAKPVFTSLAGTFFEKFNQQIVLDSNKIYQFFKIQDGSIADAKQQIAGGKLPTNLLFSTPDANGKSQFEVTNNSDNDGYKVSVNADELVLNVVKLESVNVNSPIAAGRPNVIGSKSQTAPEGRTIDLSDFVGQTLKADITTTSSAAYTNNIGFYVVEDSIGTIKLANGSFVKPGDANYAIEAIKSALTNSLQAGKTDTKLDQSIAGGRIYAPVVVTQGTFADFIAKNPTNSGGINNFNAYFNYVSANSDNVDHFRLVGNNTFGVEDMYGGGDRDFNDLVVSMKVTA